MHHIKLSTYKNTTMFYIEALEQANLDIKTRLGREIE
jgi:hypothetical protein